MQEKGNSQKIYERETRIFVRQNPFHIWTAFHLGFQESKIK